MTNPDSPMTPREETEMRLTALLMGELPPEEAKALEAQIAADPELAALHRRLRKATELLREAIALPEPTVPERAELSSERRAKLLAHFKTEAKTDEHSPAPIAQFPKTRIWSWVPMSLAAALVLFLGGNILNLHQNRTPLVEKERESVSDLAPTTGATYEPINAFGASSRRVATAPAIAPEAPRPATITKPGAGTKGDYGLSAYNETRSNAGKDVDLAGQRPIRKFDIPTGAMVDTGSMANPTAANGNDGQFQGGFESRTAGAAGAPPNNASVNLGQVQIRGQAQAKPTAENPIVGRLAFWNDTDTPKVNIDTSGGVAMTGRGTTAAPASVPVLKDIPILGNTFSSGGATGTAEITVNGGGTLTLSGSNTYTGATTINAGTLSSNTTGNVSNAQPTDAGASDAESRDLQGKIASNSSAMVAAPMPTPAPDETVTDALKMDLQKAQAEAAEAKQMVDSLIAKGKENEGKLAELQRTENLRSKGVTSPGIAGKAKSGSATPAPAAKAAAAKRAPAAKPADLNLPSAGGLVTKSDRLYPSIDELHYAKEGATMVADADASEVKAKKAEAAPAEPAPEAPIAPGAMGTNPLTAGVQSGRTAISANAIDALSFDTGIGSIPATRRADDPAAPAAEASAAAPAAQNDGLGRLTADGMKPNDPQAAAADNAGNQISQQAPPNLLRELAVASLKNERIKELLNKHGYNVHQQAPPANGTPAASTPAPAPASPDAAAGAKGPATEIAKLDKELTELKQEMKSLQEAQKSAAEPEPQRATPPQPAAIPQPEVATSANPFSTFSLNVSDVAFKLAAASLEKGQMPEPATVRTEEFINAFDYRDPEPAGGAPLALASEQARYPFAQNRDLLRLSVKTAAAGRQPGRALNLVLLLDNSGSMERADRVNILREALRVLCTQLQPQDKLSVVTFARTPRLWADGVSGNQAAAVTARVGEITPQGGTNLEAALDLGYATAQRHAQQGSISRVVLITDGAANLGDVNPEALKRKVEDRRRQGIALDCFGIGWEGLDDTLLETLSRNGDGRYGFINSAEEAATEFAGQLAGALRVAASDVKVQVEFNPKRVTAYRQIGYAKHQLTKEQFRDNTVDAAEIGAAESGNALYLLEVNPRGEGDVATVRVRFKVPGTTDYREHEWSVPFEGNGVPALDQASPALRLAGTASAFAEWLVSSPYATEVTPDRLLGLINGVPAKYVPDARPKKLEWMIRQAKRVSGR